MPGRLLGQRRRAGRDHRHREGWAVFRSYGEHLAARGLVGVPFNHRSTNRGEATEAAADVRSAIAFVREHARELGVDKERVGVWVFSAGGPFGLAPLLQRRPDWLRCATGFCTFWDLGPFRASPPTATNESMRRWSCLTALDPESPDLPPLLLARAGRDSAPLLEGTDTFVRRARQRGIDLTVLDHASRTEKTLGRSRLSPRGYYVRVLVVS